MNDHNHQAEVEQLGLEAIDALLKEYPGSLFQVQFNKHEVAMSLSRVLKLADLLTARNERDELKKQLGTLAQQFDALSNLICNASDTLRSRGFESPTPFDERVIKLAQAYDALMAIAVAANSDAPIPNRLDDIEKAITAAQEKRIEIK